MTTDSLPLVFGSDEQFLALRSALAGLHYEEPSICARTGVQSIFDFRTKRENRDIGIELNDALDSLIHLLMDGESMHRDHLRTLAPAPWLAALEALGVLAAVPGQPQMVYATVFLYPVLGLYIASDRGRAIDDSDITHERQVVYPAITSNTRRFLSSLPHAPGEDLLDLCSGSGIAALAGAATYAKHAWSCDLGERCALFAEFNRRLNGIVNVTCAQGDLYKPVAGRTFDRIVAHPPYVPSESQDVLFRDGGADGEQVMRGVIEGLPDYLRPGGWCCCQTMATDREGESFEHRIRKWLGERQHEFDVLLIANAVHSRDEFIQTSKRNPKAADLSPLFDALKVTAVYYGGVVLQRFTEAREPVTVRIRKAGSADGRTTEWLIRWVSACASPGFDSKLRGERPRLNPHLTLNITQVVQDGALVPSQCELSSSYPFHISLNGGWLAALVGYCDGRRTVAELLREMRQREILPADVPESRFLQDLRTLITCGFLEIESFPLPRLSAAHAG